MSGIETIATIASIGSTLAGTVIGVQGARYQAESQANALNYEAQVRDMQAAESRAVADRQAIAKRREADLLISRQRAVAAASGGGTGGSASELMQNAAVQGDYNARIASYEGENRARGLNDQARLNRVGAQNAIQAGNIQAAGTIVSGISSMAQRFAGSGFTMPTFQTQQQPNGILPPGSSGLYYG